MELGTFESFKVIPVPKLVKENLFLYINVPHDYIIINDEKLLYTLSEKNYLETCKKYLGTYFCKRAYPNYQIHMFEGCLSKIINEPIELKQDDCNTKLIKVTNTMWIQLKDNQHWIFAAPALETLRITCQTNVKEVVISET